MLADSTLVPLIATSNPTAAREFYERTLGLHLTGEDPHGLAFRMGDQMLRVTKVEAFTPHPFSVLSWRVPDIVAAIHKLSERGVVFARFPCFEQDELGIWAAPSGTKIAWFHDPDGNALSIVQVQRAA